MNEVTARSVGAEASRVERATQLRLVPRMAVYGPQLSDTVCKLALVAVTTRPARLFVRPTQLRLIAGGGAGGGGRRRRAVASRRKRVVGCRRSSSTLATDRRRTTVGGVRMRNNG